LTDKSDIDVTFSFGNTLEEEAFLRTMTQACCLDLGPNNDLSVLFGS
jgi:hypothetical protein